MQATNARVVCTVCALLLAVTVLPADAARVPVLREIKVSDLHVEDGVIAGVGSDESKTVAESDKGQHPLCDVCVQFVADNRVHLVADNIKGDEGVNKGSCSATCSRVPGALDEKVCALLCENTGDVSSFADAIKKSNPEDTIAACELLGSCGSKHPRADAASNKEEAESSSEVDNTKSSKETSSSDKEETTTTMVYASIREHFEAWMKEFEKEYESKEEHEKRLEIFKANKAFVEKHNAEHAEGKHGHWVGLNHLADLTKEEYKQMLGYKSNLLSARPPVDAESWEYAKVEAKKDVDWVAAGAVTPVKNQGQCGSCWAFSTTGSVEGANFVATGKLVSVSEQELVSCSHNGNQGCSGGLMDNAFQWIVTNKGLDTETDYKYTAGAGVAAKCSAKKEKKHVVAIDAFKDVPPNAEKELEKAVTMQPVSVAIEADHQSFQLYKGGVFSAKDCGTALDHGVLVVGYGFDSKSKGHKHFWKIKNSWGPAWGEEGYIRISKGGGAAAGQCGVAMQPSYPTKTATKDDVEAIAEM